MATVLIHTAERFDARLLGYERACNPREDAEGLIVTKDDGPVLSITLEGPEGEVTLSGSAEIREVAKSLMAALGVQTQRAA